MNGDPDKPMLQYSRTALAPCPYLPERQERKVVIDLSDPVPGITVEDLTRAGFRRSRTVFYKPACPGCKACVPVRLPVNHFTPSRSFRRIIRRNRDLNVNLVPPVANREQFDLLQRYLKARHGDDVTERESKANNMDAMTYGDYMTMIEETPALTHIAEYRDDGGALIALALTDQLADSLSMTYSFFDPSEGRRSLGSFMILDHIARAHHAGLRHVYLGYWVQECRKMSYKARFQPFEVLTQSAAWRLLEINHTNVQGAKMKSETII